MFLIGLDLPALAEVLRLNEMSQANAGIPLPKDRVDEVFDKVRAETLQFYSELDTKRPVQI